VDDAHAHLGVLDLLQLRDGGFDRPVDVALEDEVEILDATLLHLGEELLERDAGSGGRGQLFAPQALAPVLGEVARAALVLDDTGHLAGRRRMVETENLDRIPRSGILELVPAEVVERANAAPGVTGDDRVADLQRPAMDEHRRDRSSAHVEPGLDDRPGRICLGVGGQDELGVGDEQHLLEQVVEILLLLGRDVGELRGSAPFLRLEILAGQVAADPVRVRVRDVDLVHGDDDRHLGRPRVRDGLPRLRHDAVVRCHD
jgi:hypothetical protein